MKLILNSGGHNKIQMFDENTLSEIASLDIMVAKIIKEIEKFNSIIEYADKDHYEFLILKDHVESLIYFSIDPIVQFLN